MVSRRARLAPRADTSWRACIGDDFDTSVSDFADMHEIAGRRYVRQRTDGDRDAA
jgi:hypothetical protein